MFFVKTPILLMKVFPELIWRYKEKEKEKTNHIYLTFDDGPSESTPALLDVLARHKARATFFVCGANVLRLPHLAQRAAAEVRPARPSPKK